MAEKGKKNFWNFVDKLEGDKVVWIIALMLMMFSVICIFSSTSRLLSGGQTRLDMVKEQLVTVAIGLAVLIICYNIRNVKILKFFSMFGFAISMGLLLTLLSGVDLGFVKSVEINGARRILKLGSIQLHVNEVVKVAMVMYLAWAIDALRNGKLRFFAGDVKRQRILYIYAPFIITTLCLLPGSNSAALFTGGIMFLVILLGGDSGKDMLLLLLAAVALLLLCIGIYKVSGGRMLQRIGTGIERVLADDDMERQALESKPGTQDFQEAIDEIRQPYSAKIAVHQGGLIGKGPGQSTQRYIVPDISEDYMYSFIIEEYGILGGFLVLILYLSLLARGSLIVRNCGPDRNNLFGKLAVAGLVLLISGQAFLHIMVNVDIGPMTGQTLPLVSHGRSAFLCFSLAFGILLSISRIASKAMAKEQLHADPLVDRRQEMAPVENDLADLDRFETDGNTEETIDEEDYGL